MRVLAGFLGPSFREASPCLFVVSLWRRPSLHLRGTASLAQESQPRQQIVRLEANGSISLTGQIQKPVYETVTYEYTVMVPYSATADVEVNGEKRQVTRSLVKPETRTAVKTVCKHVCVTECSPMDLKTAKAFEVDGRRIPVGELSKRLTNDSVVVVSATDGMIPDYYAAIYKPGTIILASPRTMMGMPAPMPGPILTPQPVPQPAAPLAPPAASHRLAPGLVQPVSFQPPVPSPPPPVAVPVGERAPGPWDLLPKTPAPLIAFAMRTGADELKIRQFAERQSFAEFTTVAGDGPSAHETMMKGVTVVRHSETITVPLKVLQFATPASDDIAPERIKEKLGVTEQTVLLSADGKQVDEFWLKTIKPSVLVLSGVKLNPVSASGGPPAPWPYSPTYSPAMPMPGPPPAPSPPAAVPAPAVAPPAPTT